MALNQSGQIWGEIDSHRTMAILASAGRKPDWQQVTIHMKKSIELSTRAQAMTELVVSLYRFAELMRKRGDIDNAQAYFRQARDHAAKIGCHTYARIDCE